MPYSCSHNNSCNVICPICEMVTIYHYSYTNILIIKQVAYELYLIVILNTMHVYVYFYLYIRVISFHIVNINKVFNYNYIDLKSIIIYMFISHLYESIVCTKYIKRYYFKIIRYIELLKITSKDYLP